MVEMSQTASGQIEEVSRKEFWEIVGLLLEVSFQQKDR